jgi:membrane protein YqaA with SNARE-associated domain
MKGTMGNLTTPPPAQRFLAPIAVTVIAAALGACSGYLLARTVTLRAIQSKLQASATMTLSRTDAFYRRGARHTERDQRIPLFPLL